METKLKFRDELKSFAKQHLETDIEKLPPTKQSKAMTRFYVQRIRGVFNPGLVPTDPDDLDTCLVDGENDCGVDFLSRSDGTVLIIQAKFRGYGVNEKLDDVVGFCEVLRRIHPETGKKYKKSQKLLEALTDVDWDNDTFELAFISLGRLGPNLRAKEQEGPSLPERDWVGIEIHTRNSNLGKPGPSALSSSDIAPTAGRPILVERGGGEYGFIQSYRRAAPDAESSCFNTAARPGSRERKQLFLPRQN
jgi:hypothetical protein